jgi:hypothetical protein
MGKAFRGIIGCDYFSAYREFLRETDVLAQNQNPFARNRMEGTCRPW